MSAPRETRRVLHLVNGEFYAGAERVQDLLALQLGAHGFEVQFACVKDGIFAAQRRAQGARLHAMPMRSRADLALGARIARVARREGIRLLHTHTPRTALLGNVAARLAGVPMVHHVHSPSERDTESPLRNLRNTAVEQLSLRGARRLIVVSSSLERYLRDRGFSKASIREVPNGVPVGDRRRMTFAGGGELHVGMVALFRPRKGVEVLLEAIARLAGAGVPVRLHAIGPFETPDYESEVRAMAARLGIEGRVEWAGFQPDVALTFERMHVFVLPSLFGEGMPMVVLEAMAAGLPIVSTRVEGIPQVVRDGVDGILTNPGDADELAAALLRFARGEADAARMGDSGWQRQREQFSDSAMAARVANIYREVLDA